MVPTTSFAPLAARLTARADEIRPVDGAEVSWANFMALFFCAILGMLILLCEALDARAMAAPVARDGNARPVLAARLERSAMPGAGRALRLARADDAPATPTARDAALAGPAASHPEGQLLAWSPPWPALCWRPPRLMVLPRNETLPPKIQHVYFITKS